MHPALQNPSIVAEIFDCFSASSPSGRADAKSCLNGALTCKQFLSPALDVIWWKLYDLRPLFGLIQGVQPLRPVHPSQPVQLSSAGPLSLSNIEIMKAYARRVRSISLVNKYAVDILIWVDPLILNQFPILLENKPLFPRLQKLHIQPYIHGNHQVVCSSYLSLFFSPSLQNVVFDFVGTPKALHAHSIWWFFRNMDTMSASSLQIKTIQIGVSLPRLVIASLSKLPKLERLVLSPRHDTVLDFSLLRELTALPSLNHLSLSITAQSKKTPTPPLYTKPCFTSLRSICLHSDVNTAYGMFSLFEFPALETLKFARRIADTPSPFQPESWETFLVQLPHWVPSLRSICLNIADQESQDEDEDEVEEDNPISLLWSCFFPLLSLSLTTLSIQLPMVDSLSNQDIIDIATSSPALESLQIKVRKLQLDRHVLPEIIKRLPCLKELFLSINLYDIRPEWLSEIPTSSHKLARLVVPRMKDRTAPESEPPLTLKQMYTLAQYVDALFPHLKFVSCQADCDFWTPDGTSNYFLQSLVEGLQYARTKERDRVCL